MGISGGKEDRAEKIEKREQCEQRQKERKRRPGRHTVRFTYDRPPIHPKTTYKGPP